MPRTEFELALFWNSLTAIMVIDAKSLKFLEVNPSALDLYGFSRKEFLNMKIQDIKPGKEVERLMKYLFDDEAAFSKRLGIWMQKKKSGDILYVMQSVQKFKYHGREALLIHAHDVTSEHNAKLELEEARRLNETLIDNLPDGFFLLNKEGQFIRWNRRFEKLSGYDEKEIPVLSCNDLYESSDVAYVSNSFTRLSSGDSVTMEAPLIKKDGTSVPCYYSASGFKINNKKYIIGTCRDLRTLKALEIKARKEKRRFRQTFEQAAVGIAHVGLDGRWLRVNDNLCQVLGYDRQELLGTDFQAVTYPDDLEADLYHIQKLIDGEIDTYTIDKRYIRKSGEIIWGRLTVSSVWDGDTLEYFISVVQDITESYRLQERLIEAQEIGKIGNWELNIKKDELYWSDEVYKIFGVADKDAFKSNFDAFFARVHPKDRDELMQAQEKALHGDAPLNLEHRIVLPNGQIHTVFERGKLRYDRKGNPAYLVGTVQDITDLKETEDALRRALKEKEVALGEMHHRVKNNLAVISALFSLHREKQSKLSPVEIINLIEQQIKTISRIHEELYKSPDLSRIPILRILQKHLKNELFTKGIVDSVSLPQKEIYINANQAITFFLMLSEIGLELSHICSKTQTKIKNLNLYIAKEQVNVVYSLSLKDSNQVLIEIERLFSKQPIIYTLMDQLGIESKIDSTSGKVHIQFKLEDMSGSVTTLI